MMLSYDNQVALNIDSNLFHETKIDCYFNRENILLGNIMTNFENSNNQLNNVFTKSLRGP